MKIAVSGKGGVGKTTVSSTLVKLFANRGYKVYAVDADPDTSLGAALGIADEVLRDLKPVVDMSEVIKEKSAGGGAMFVLNPKVDDVLETYSHREGNISFLRMGGIKSGGTACYCKENSFLHAVIDALLLDSNEVVIMDMGAGIEHLTRGTARGVDVMLIVTEPSKVSIQTANVVRKLAGELGVQQIKVIGNKIRNDKDAAFVRSGFGPEEVLGMIGFNESILDQAMDPGSSGSSASELIPEIVDIFQKLITGAGGDLSGKDVSR